MEIKYSPLQKLLSRQWSLNEPVSGMDQADLRNLLRSI